ncbi:MAG TPA: hypothetical protein VFG74_04330, partial [Miltoncostaeaceae bacterium]|nr:hypothetical protein [Miltoncostaeaceae bacterium]
QTATNTNVVPIAAAPAVAAQVVPVNANVPVSVLSDAPSGDVSQTNRALADGTASNTAASQQQAPALAKDGKGTKGAEGAGGSQTATNTNVVPIAAAPAVAAQVVPVNANVPVSLFAQGGDEADGKGPAGPHQSNVAAAGGAASNTAASGQYGSGTQTATNTQVLPIALAPSIAPQVLPINANVPVTVGNPLAVLPPLPVDPLAVLANPVGTVTGLLPPLPVNPAAVLANPVGTVTGLLPPLPVNPAAVLANPVGTVTGLLPVGAVTGLLPALPLGAVTGLLPLGAVTGLLPPLPVALPALPI